MGRVSMVVAALCLGVGAGCATPVSAECSRAQECGDSNESYQDCVQRHQEQDEQIRQENKDACFTYLRTRDAYYTCRAQLSCDLRDQLNAPACNDQLNAFVGAGVTAVLEGCL